MMASKWILITTILSVVALSLIVDAQQPPAPTPTNCTAHTVKPVPDIGKYVFKTCIVAQFSAYLSIGQGKFIELNKGLVDSSASVCDNSTSVPKVNPKLVIQFPCASLAIDISHTNDSKTYVSAITGYYQTKEGNVTFANSTENFYTTQSGHYYRCNSEQSVPMGDNSTVLMLSQFALEAYRDTSGTDFYQIPEYCVLDSPPVSDLVRIGVGICLVALVAIVLIAYFIGRRRWSERSSYESV